MAEMAFVSARRGRLRQMAEDGHKGAKVALDLIATPNRFLSTVQVGITLIGIVAGAFGGAKIAAQLAVFLNRIEWLAPYSEPASFVLVVGLITFLSLVIGELVPKRVALSKPVGLAVFLARPMSLLSSMTGPVISLLGNSTDLVLRILGVRSTSEPVVTEDEVKAMVEQGHHAGVFHKAEIRMVEGVMQLDRVKIGEIMTPTPSHRQIKNGHTPSLRPHLFSWVGGTQSTLEGQPSLPRHPVIPEGQQDSKRVYRNHSQCNRGQLRQPAQPSNRSNRLHPGADAIHDHPLRGQGRATGKTRFHQP